MRRRRRVLSLLALRCGLTASTPTLNAFTRDCAGPFFVAGDDEPIYLVFSPPNLGKARVSASVDAPFEDIGAWWKPWFCSRVRAVCGSVALGGYKRETVPIYAYLMRHDRSMCMTMETVMPFGNDEWFRLLFGWSLPPKMSLLKA